jgi:hypothetical protein
VLRLRAVFGWLLLAMLAGTVGLRAQSPAPGAPRPYRGLFAGDEEGTTRTESFELNASGYGGYDSNIAFNQPGLFGPVDLPPVLGPVGPSNVNNPGSQIFGGTATVSYNKRWQRANFSTYGGASTSRYPAIANGMQTGYFGGAGFDVPLSRRYSLQASTAVSRSPFYELSGVFPSLPGGVGSLAPTAPTLELGLVPAVTLHLLNEVRLSRDFSKRSRIAGFAVRSSTNFEGGRFSTSNTTDTRAGFEFDRVVSRYATLRLGYDYRIGQLGTREEQRFRSHEINAGIDYHRAFNLWHRTTFSFTTGSTMLANQPLAFVTTPPPTSPDLRTDSLVTTDRQNTDLRVIVTGTASLVWEFLRSWSARASYVRGLAYLEGFVAPTLTNAASASVGGLISRRVQATGGLSYSTGEVGTATLLHDNGYASWNASGILDYAINRHVAAYARYFYYNYQFQRGVALPPGLRSNYERQGVRFGVKTWVPLCRCR